MKNLLHYSFYWTISSTASNEFKKTASNELKKIATTNRKANTDIGRNIREFNINSDFIEANFLYFRDQYDFGYSPYDVLSQIDTDKSEIFVKLEELSDDMLLEIVHKFIDTPFSNVNKYVRRNNMIKEIEND